MCTTAVGRWPLFATIIWCLATTTWSEPKPPKFLPRVIAGFYSYHPSYDTDIPAEVKTTKSKTSVAKPAESNQNRYYYKQYQHQFNTVLHQYKHQYHYPGDYREKFHGTKKHPKLLHPPISSVKHYRRPNYATNHYFRPANWHSYAHTPHLPDMSHVLKSYIILAQKLALFYGRKYNYPVNTLYWQIIDVMFS